MMLRYFYGIGIGDVGEVIHDCIQLANDGVVIIGLTVSRATSKRNC